MIDEDWLIYCIDCGYLLFQNSSMEKYYEILDVKYWKSEHKTGQRFPRYINRGDDSQVLKVIGLMGLSFLFWGLAGQQGVNYSVILNLIGWFFALCSLYMVRKLNFHRRRES